jgi:hypothetical protein
VITDAQAQAVTEAAKTTGEIVKAAGGLGSYLAKVFGSIPEDTLGLIVGDWLAHKRRRHLAVLEDNTVRKLEEVDAQRLTEPSPSILIPLLQGAIDEGRAELQDLWASLLANAMVDGGKRVRRDYFDAVRQMEPLDATVLDVVARSPNQGAGDSEMLRIAIAFIEQERQRLGIPYDDLAIATGKLVKLDCLTPPRPHYPASLTPFGRGLLMACKPP